MTVRSPATSFVAALDEPWRWVRDHFSEWAPVAFGLGVLGVFPGLLMQWFSAAFAAGTVPGAMPDLGSLAGLGVSGTLSVFAYAVIQLGSYVLVTRILDGERPRFGEVLRTALSLRMLILGGLPLAFIFMGFGCLVGGPVAAALLGFAPVAAAARSGTWGSTWTDAFTRATVRASPRDAGPPAYKLAAIALIWYGILSVVGQLAALPTFAWMGWKAINALGSNPLEAIQSLQASPPFAIGAATVLISAVLRPFSDLYLAAGVAILWRDVARVREGADLLAIVDGRAA